MAKEYNTNHIYYNTYNIFIKKWGKSLTKISHSKTDNIYPYLFIDSRDNIHVLWYSLENNKYLVTYKQLSSVGKKKYNWEEIKLSKIIGSKFPPLMFENKNELKILCIIRDEIQYLVSKNYGRDWNLENKIPLNSLEIDLIKYVHNNLSSSIDSKINHSYGSFDGDEVNFFFDENLNNELHNDEISIKTFKSDNQKTNDLKNEQEVVETKEEIETKTEEELQFLKEIVDTVNDIKKDMELIKGKIQKIEEKQNTKKGFFR